MGAREFLNSLRPGSDKQLASTQYEGRESASDAAAKARRQRHRAAVLRDGDNQKGRVPKSWTRDRE
ncbi:hypothetical protein ACFY3M_13760 [Streptomyces mirabilis]|uniref:hypothetical protein n=1 Tax=Streptomyces mirabilis TaxID=68239 RepID=UPI0036829194